MEVYDKNKRWRDTGVTWQQVKESTEAQGVPLTKAKAKKLLRQLLSEEQWVNDLYNVAVSKKTQGGILMTVMAITRHDKGPVHNWRHFQLIKNDIIGEDAEAIEIYPSESRLVDTANTYWLYGFPKGRLLPFGMHDLRNVSGPEVAAITGAVQEPFDD